MIKLLLVAFSAGASIGLLEDCPGCFREDQTWGGGAAFEVWTYTPGAGDDDGHCTPSCGWDVPCKFTGTLSFTNGGTGARDVWDNNGGIVPGGPIPVGGVWGPVAVTIKAPCGATGDAAQQYQAHVAGGAALTSAYMFYCSGCFDV